MKRYLGKFKVVKGVCTGYQKHYISGGVLTLGTPKNAKRVVRTLEPHIGRHVKIYWEVE